MPRSKVQGRFRICYVASSSSKTIIVLYISETLRKAGDAKDPYVLLTRMVNSGRFDADLEKLGIKTHGR